MKSSMQTCSLTANSGAILARLKINAQIRLCSIIEVARVLEGINRFRLFHVNLDPAGLPTSFM